VGGRGATAVLLGAFGLILAGCGLLPGARGISSAGCSNIASAGACSEQIDRIAARHPGASQVDITCGVPVCDRRSGSGTAVVTFPDGSTVRDTFAYTGDPAPLPVPSCTGLAPDLCGRIAVSQADSAPPSKRITGIAVVCSGACTPTKGEAEVTVSFSDGSQEGSGVGWEGGLP
jgi:hypothetical protein